MKKLLSFLIIVFFSQNLLFAKKVETEKAQTVAKNFLSEKIKNINQPELEFFSSEKSKSDENLFYIFNFKNSVGFIIISAYDNIYPVLAYSFENNYKKDDTKPDAFIDWMQELKNK